MKKGLVGAALLVATLLVAMFGVAFIVSASSATATPPASCTAVSEPDLQTLIADAPDPAGEGGVGFALPEPGTPRLSSLRNAARPIPDEVKGYYVAAAAQYHLPWTLLAGIGMEETGHGATSATSSAGAQGLMQFMPATWARYGVDGAGDGRADIRNPADSAMSAANYLTASGVTTGGADGVRRALFAYNHADWYVNDVLFYAAAYGGGIVQATPPVAGQVGRATRTCPRCPTRRSVRSSSGRSRTSASRMSWGERTDHAGTAHGSPGPRSPRSGSPCPAPPPRSRPGWRTATGSGCRSARNSPVT